MLVSLLMIMAAAQQESALGADLAEDFRQRSALFESAAARDYVERLGRRLAAQFPVSFSYSFEIRRFSPNQVNEPIAYPRGYVFVPPELFLAARDEAEFAGMLAHAMAHSFARHGIREARKFTLANMAGIPLVYTGNLMREVRANEREADLLAVQAMSRAGFDPAALARYIGRTPRREARVSVIEEAIASLPAGTYAEGDEFGRVRDEVRGLIEKLETTPPTLRRSP